MESTESIDPLEKRMQEFEQANATSNSLSTTPPPMELPHRPIMLPAEVKEEPVETETAQVAAIACAEKAVDNQLEVSQIAILATDEQGLGHQSQALLTSAQSTNNAVSSMLDTGDTITAENLATNAVSLEAVSASNVPMTCAITATTKTADSIIKVKTEVLEDGELDDGSNESATAKQTPALEEVTQQDSEIIRIKTEPIDKNVEGADQVLTQITNNAATKESSPTAPVGSAEPDETLPDNFFDDLLQNADDITAAALKAPKLPAAASPARVTAAILNDEIKVKSEPTINAIESEPIPSAPIPENFFDDLLVDHVAERIEDVVNNDLEIKFSERLKELEQLEAATSKAHKKHKKKKKKSHKRSHAEAVGVDVSPYGKHKRSKGREVENATPLHPHPLVGIRVKSEFSNVPLETINLVEDEEPTTSKAAAVAATAAQAKPSTKSAPTGRLRIKSEFATFPIEPPTLEEVIPDISLPVRESELFQRCNNVNRNGLIVDMTAPLGFKRIKMEKDVDKPREQPSKNILPADKMERARQRALEAIEAFKTASKQEKEPMSSIIHTTTIRKLPSSHSFHKQQIYENRSPLNNVNNVSFKFNSHAFRFNLYEWGIEEMPPEAAKVAKVLGMDYYGLLKKLETFKIPVKLQKIKKECMEKQNELKMYQPQSSFLITVATQTNEVTVLESASARRKNAHHIGVQAIPECKTFGTQTICLTNSTFDDLPLMRQISTLNENQLIALSDFVDLISEPVKPETSAIDLYRLRTRLGDIYKCSQEPSALEPTVQKQQQQQQPQQQQPLKTNSNNNINIRDPRNRAKVGAAAAVDVALDEEPPPPPPLASALASGRQVHAVHHPQQKPTAQQKIPVITNVQSYHPSSGLFPPASTLEASSSRYYGRGGMRR